MTPIERLRTTKENLAPRLRGELLALRRDAVPELMAILAEEISAGEGEPDAGWPAIHAAGLLIDLKASAAIEVLLDVLCEIDFDEVLFTTVDERLPELGAAVLEPALARFETADADSAEVLADLMNRLGLRDERIFGALCEVFEDNRALGALLLGDYGDEAAIAVLEKAIDDFVPDFADAKWRATLVEMLQAHEKLGGELDDVLLARLAAIDDIAKQRVVTAAVPGRNDPCHCKSGKKYKKCCEAADQATRAAIAKTRPN